jgi:hypothetical protein
MRRVNRADRPPRILAAGVAALVILAGAVGCSHDKTKAGSDPKAMNVIAAQIQTNLAQRPGVVQAKVVYQDSLDTPGNAAIAIGVQPGTDLGPIVDNALQLIWQSPLNPLRYIQIDVGYDQSTQPGISRNVDPVKDRAELDQKYGPHPTR